jgi:hypothetical protein
MIIYQIKLPAKQDAATFAAFMKDEYFPAVHKGPTRVGQVVDLALLQGRAETNAPNHEFFLQAGYNGLATGDIRIDDEAVAAKFKGFGAKLKRLGFFKEIAAWNEDEPE